MGCPLHSEKEPWHFAQPVPKLSIRIDIEYLKSLILYGYQGRNSTCTYIGHLTSRRTKCGKFDEIYCVDAEHMLTLYRA